ncbi:MAG: hypothetical protein ACRDPV_00615 [Gaiellaceae bacterium]
MNADGSGLRKLISLRAPRCRRGSRPSGEGESGPDPEISLEQMEVEEALAEWDGRRERAPHRYLI